jgi:hypothetical protein
MISFRRISWPRDPVLFRPAVSAGGKRRLIECKNMNARELMDFSAFLISLAHSTEAMKDQAVTIGNNDLEASFTDSSTNLEVAIRLSPLERIPAGPA